MVVPVIPVCQALDLSQGPVFTRDHVDPFVLESTYQFPEFDQLPCRL